MKKEAIRVKEFAKQYKNGKGCNVSYVYKLIKEGKLRSCKILDIIFVYPD